MSDLPSLDGLSSAQLLALAEAVAARYEVALAEEAAAQVTAREKLLELARALTARLGPEKPQQGNLLSLREAKLMSSDALASKPGPVLQMILETLCDVACLARDSVLIAADQAR